MIPSDLKAALSSPQKIKDDVSQSLEARTSQFTTTFLQSSDLETSPKNPSLTNSDIERSKNLIHVVTKQKIEELPKDVESHYYKQLLQAKREDLIQEQIFYLEKLSDLYLEKQNWVQAAKLLNCALAISEKHLDDSSYLYTKLERVEVLFLESKGFKTPNHHTGSVLNHRDWLKNIRILYVQQYQEKVPIQEIITFLTNSYRKLLGTIILDSQEFLGTPPSQWACVGMGSMARDEMCPYSDLEFAFLIDKKTEQILDYFRTLAQLVELRIINLGETKFPIFAQLFGEKSIAASPTPGGFSMDSGGNTPLGKPGFYELIDTPQGLAQYQCVYWMEADFIVTNALSTTCHVVGDEKLVYTYNRSKEEMLNKRDGYFSFTGTPFRSKLALKLLNENLGEFKPNLSKEKQETNAFGIKKELYRPLQSLLSTLSLFCSLELQSTLVIIQQLLKQKILSSKGAENLTKALNQILSLRFEAHTFYQNEEEFLLHKEQGVSQDPHFLYLDEEHLKTLHDIYMVLIPLQHCGEKFLETQDLKIFSKNIFYDSSPLVKGTYFKKTLQYGEAQKAFQNAVSLDPHNIDAQLQLGGVEQYIGKDKEALPRLMTALTLAQQKYGANHSTVATIYNNLGMAYKNLNLTKALDYFQKALNIWLDSEKDEDALEVSYNNIGMIHKQFGDDNKALMFFKKALEVTGGKPYSIAIYSNIGYAEENLGNNTQALYYYHTALSYWIPKLGENHPDVALCYDNMGVVYNKLKAYDEAQGLFQKALKILVSVFGEKHPDVAQCYANNGSVFVFFEKYELARGYYEKAFKIQQEVLSEDHPDKINTFVALGVIFYMLNDFHEALDYLQGALGIALKVLGKSHSQTQLVMQNLLNCAKKLPASEVGALMEIGLHSTAFLGRQHPFIQELYQIIEQRIEQVIDDKYPQKSSKIEKKI